MSLGINECLRAHIRNAAHTHWGMQRETVNNPVCIIKKKLVNTNLPSYLDNKEQYMLFEDVPVLPDQIRYKNQWGKVIVEKGLYFTFRFEDLEEQDPTFFIPEKDVIIIYDGNDYVITQIEDDESAGLIRVETKLV
jgi:hypothetical protein